MFTKDLEIIKTAIINEQEGYLFYLLAAEKADSQEVKEVFTALASDEKDHEEWLRTFYREIIDKKQPIQMAIKEYSHSPEIFSADKLKNFGGLTVSALHIGVMMEKESMAFYQKAASETSLSELQELLQVLAQWESNHLQILDKAYDFARDEWWERQGFSPA